jgi:hypothetical protein
MAALFAGLKAWKHSQVPGSLALVMLLGLAVSGCSVAAALPAAGIAATVEGVSLNQTGQTASDHLASWVTGDDCNILRSQKDGGHYCRSAAELAEADAKLHRPYFGDCYRVRGNVTCYTQPDATHTSEATVYNAP